MEGRSEEEKGIWLPLLTRTPAFFHTGLVTNPLRSKIHSYVPIGPVGILPDRVSRRGYIKVQAAGQLPA